MATFDEFITSIRTDFGEQGAGKPFEVFCKWFLENDPEWSKTVDKVWLWDDYPNKWQRQDLGTDLVFRDNEGLIWAVQAKCYDEHRTTTKGDMNSFLADTGRKEVDRRLWMQTTNKMEAKADKTLKGQDKPVTVFDLNSFRDAPLDYPASFADLYEAKVKAKPIPDTHQIKAIEDATSGLKSSDRGQMIMACGTGKTFTTLWIKEALEAHTTLVLLPSLSLLSQTMREWAWAGNTDFDILNVCSDKSVGKKTEDMDPADAPFPVTSEIEEIAKFLKQPKPKVVFCTYQSSDLIAQAQLDGSVPSFDLAVADEAHRCAGKADAGFATILDGEKIRASKRLFTTATPRYFGKAIKDEAKARDLAVVGMDDEAVFGPVIHKLTFGQAIEQELLTDYQVVIVGVDEPMVREWIENYEIVSTDPDSQTDARTLAAKIGMLKAVKDYDLRRVISFHSRVAGAKQFSDELLDVANLIEPINRPEGTFLSDYVSGAMKAGDRKEKIDRLKVLEGYDRGILTNARCLAEGVDVPSLDGVAFIDPKGSQVEIIQAVGRAIRKVRGAKVQKKGTIVLPVFIEDGDDHEASIEASNFKPVYDVLKALRAHDEDMASTLDQYRTNMAKNASKSRQSISDKIIFDMPVSVDAEFSSALRTVLVEASTASWEFWFGLLEEFYKNEGHSEVPQHYTFDGHNLGSWVTNQRMLKKGAGLDFNREERLNKLQFEWDPQDKYWWENFEKLKVFQQLNSHCRVTKASSLQAGISYSWITAQRRHWRKGVLNAEYVSALEAIGFSQDVHSDLFYDGVEHLKEFLKQNSISELRNKVIMSDGFQLGNWISQKKANKKKGLLPSYQIEILTQLGIDWTEHGDQSFASGLSALRAFLEIYKHPHVPGNFITNDKLNLGNWCLIQRRAYARGTLKDKNIQKLESLNFLWDGKSASDEKKWFDHFHEYQKSTSTHLNKKLTQWVNDNVEEYLRGDLSHQRLENLNSINFNWIKITDKIAPKKKKSRNLELITLGNIRDYLKPFMTSNGHSVVAPDLKIENNFPLGILVKKLRKNKDTLPIEIFKECTDLGFSWSDADAKWQKSFKRYKDNHPVSKKANLMFASRQRKLFKNNALGAKKITQLRDINFQFDPYDDTWINHFEALKQFRELHGHANVPYNYVSEIGVNLGSWITNLRARFKSGTLAKERVVELESLGLVWSVVEALWQEKYSLLKDFYNDTGHSNVPASYKTSCGTNLGSWINQQRGLRKKGKLSLERIGELDMLNFNWEVLGELWMQSFNELKFV